MGEMCCCCVKFATVTTSALKCQTLAAHGGTRLETQQSVKETALTEIAKHLRSFRL